MAKRRNANCRDCGKHRDKVGPMSSRGLCTGCAAKRLSANLTEMSGKRGKNYSDWVESVKTFADQL